MSVLVTGAAGFIGSHVVEALLARGESVVGLDNFAPTYPRALKEANLAASLGHPGFEFHEEDIRASNLNGTLPEGIRSVIHVAAIAGVRGSVEDPAEYVDVNVAGTVNMLEFARARRLDAFLFASSSSVYGDATPIPFSEGAPAVRPISPYAATKRAGELFCHSATHLHGFTTVCLRLFTVYGPRQRPDLAIHAFARRMREGRSIPLFGDGSSSRNYTFVGDVVDGIVGALHWARSNPGRHEVVNLGGEGTVTLGRMVTALADAMGRAPSVHRLPVQPGDVRATSADIDRAKTLFGYEPRITLEEGIAAFLDWLDGEEEDTTTSGASSGARVSERP